jgi:hypothetical protein
VQGRLTLGVMGIVGVAIGIVTLLPCSWRELPDQEN